MQNKFDVIIIGSGAGGLTSAAFLAKNGYKVLVLEQHSIPGGYLHGFKRKGFFFNSAVYSIAGCGKNGYVFHLLKNLGLENKLDFIEYKSIYKVKLPDEEFVLPLGIDNFLNYLSNIFPDEKENLELMLVEMQNLYNLLELNKFGVKTDEKLYLQAMLKWGKKSYKEFIDYYITNNKLRQIFYSLWLFCCLPESKASALYGVLMLMIHILESSHYINGGCDKLAKLLERFIIENKGEFRYSSLVKEIIIENGISTGVKLDNNDILYADVIISNSSAKNTLQNMITDTESISNIVKRRIEKLDPAISTFALYIAAKIDNKIKSPFREANQIFYFDENDNDKIFDGCNNENEKLFENILITEIPSNENEEIKTFNIYSLMSYDKVKDWKFVKKDFTEQLLNKIKIILNGYLKEIIVIESATPATFYRYTLNEKGSMYGFENTKDPYKGMKLKNEIGIKNLFLAGHWTEPGGSIYNAMTSGHKAFELSDEYLKNQKPK